MNGAVLANTWGGLFAAPWLSRSLALFGAITLLWAFALAPLQVKLENAVAALAEQATALPPRLRRDLTAMLAGAIGVLMVLK